MAFVGKDWRDPGGEYIRTVLGHWESKRISRLRIFEMLNENLLKRTYKQSLSEFQENNSFNRNMTDIFNKNPTCSGFYQPHIILKRISTKESRVVTSLSETLLALDFKVAVRDIRRFGYILRIMQIFITKKFPNLSGRAQIYIIELLQEMLSYVMTTRNNTNEIRTLLNDFQIVLEENKYNHIGSFQLWQNHFNALEKMKTDFRRIGFDEENSEVAPNFQNLPNECIIKILQNLTCPQDFEMLGLTCGNLQALVNDDLLWKQLVVLHFTEDQLAPILPKIQFPNFTWHSAYIRLIQIFGDRHYFPIKLAKCNLCSCVFWTIFGHPCSSENNTNNFIFLSPEEFVNLFQI